MVHEPGCSERIRSLNVRSIAGMSVMPGTSCRYSSRVASRCTTPARQPSTRASARIQDTDSRYALNSAARQRSRSASPGPQAIAAIATTTASTRARADVRREVPEDRVLAEPGGGVRELGAAVEPRAGEHADRERDGHEHAARPAPAMRSARTPERRAGGAGSARVMTVDTWWTVGRAGRSRALAAGSVSTP